MNNYVTVEKLTKKYGELVAVDNLSFTVGENEIFGFLGPNGAGKTTTLNVISTLSDYDRGSVDIAGYDLATNPVKIKALLGVVPQEIALYGLLTAAENIALFASLYGLRGKELKRAVDEALDFVGLADERKKRAGKLSGGMRRRLNIACGIAHRPKLIIMDEPTVGVDARSRDMILRSIRALRDGGATIIYTSHYMPEVQEIADRIAIIDKGRLAAIGTEKELLGYVTDRKSIRIVAGSGDTDAKRAAAADIAKLAGVKNAKYAEGGDELRVDVDLELANISPLLKVLMDRGVTIKSFEEEAPNLETTFLALTGSELGDDGDGYGGGEPAEDAGRGGHGERGASGGKQRRA
ncbi:MAG: ABC transporter ATP-binding protein [Clostridiales Family XIII bacterium]|jgi:ABC-2 type transport system ATP-binding protein|nr:ABC transporter ATP-binding protein [Clostridiales Family XIII bacterium]